LAGFDFQLSLALLELIRRFDNRIPNKIFLEALSDVVACDNGKFVITQAKRTLSSAALTKALDELWTIDCLARKLSFPVADQFIYQVVAARQVLRDWEGARDRWRATEGADLEALECFKARTICVCVPDPRLEAAHLLVSQFKDATPLDRVNKFLGRLIAAAKQSSFEDATNDIALELRGLRNAADYQQRRFHLWGVADRPPASILLETDPRKAVRIGERLTISDLRDGRLANRTVYDALHASCEGWLQKEDGASGKLPAFWIDGRSGSGKSAGLLHLLARLHEENPSRIIIWLGDRSELVGDVIAWAMPLFRDGHRVLLALDDPYTAERRSGFEIAVRNGRDEWDALRNSELEAGRDAIDPPVIICCGPTEQRESAEDSCYNDIEIASYSLRNETEDDLAELARWFEKRTGRLAPSLKGETLLVQRFFEWTNGDIGDFAQRFRKRLQAFDTGRSQTLVFDTVARILSLGRLYAEYPATALANSRIADPILDKAFIQLAEEETHFSFGNSRADNSQMGVRFTHPHLADAVYRVWYGRNSDRAYRRAHLRDGLRASLESSAVQAGQRLGPLWAIARVAIAKSGQRLPREISDRIDLIRDELRGLLPELYHEYMSSTPAPLIDLSVWADLNAAFELDLTPHPIAALAERIAATATPMPGLQLACQKLLEHGDQPKDSSVAAVTIIGVLDRLINWRSAKGFMWRGWVDVAIELIKQIGFSPLASRIDHIAQDQRTSPFLAGLMLELTSRVSREPTARAFIINWLDHSPTWLPLWPRIIGELHENSGRCVEFDRLGFRFLSDRPHHASWGFVWSYLWDDGVVDHTLLESRGFPWLKDSDPNHVGWSRVWKRLWDAAADDENRQIELVSCADHWLDVVNHSHRGWAYVWEALWLVAEDCPSRRLALVKRAEAWLDRSEINHGGWPYVWQELLNFSILETERHSDLTKQGLDWLAKVSPAHAGWPYAWRALWRLESDNGFDRLALSRRGDLWLGGLDHTASAWPIVWSALWKAGVEDPDRRIQLMRVAIASLSVDFTQIASRDIWERLWKVAVVDRVFKTALIEQSITFLRTVDPNLRSWHLVWKEIWSDVSSDPIFRTNLLAEAKSWLASVEANHVGWNWVWQTLWELADEHDHADLAARAHAWLSLADIEHGGWTYVWQELWADSEQDCGRRDDLAQKAENWLVAIKLNNGSWQFVWLDLWKVSHGKNRTALAVWGDTWLANVDPSHGGWSWVWKELWEEGKEIPDLQIKLRTKANVWLDQTSPGNRRWVSVIKKLAEVTNVAVEREKLIQRLEYHLGDIEGAKGWEWKDSWKIAWELTDDDPARRENLFQQGTLFLREFRSDQRGWSSIWTQLWEAAKEHPADRFGLATLGEAWLARTDSDHPRWQNIWDELWSFAAGSSEQRAALSVLAARPG
jgi:hypothetical protein